jgi:hypothetical protein
LKFRELKRILSQFCIEWDARRGKGSHGAFVGLSHVSRLRRVYVLPASQQKEVSRAYLNPLRRTFELTNEHGVSDDLFR